ncbi:MAG: hypothetical protein ABL894_14685 [Hyphomicrobium sp.]
MMRLHTIAKLVLASALLCASGIVPGTHLRAEPALDRVLSGVQVSHQKNCTALSIGFNFRVRYLNHFPALRGQELRIMLRPIDLAQASAEVLSRREAVRAPETKFAHIRAIDFEAGDAAGPFLSLQFDEPVNYEVSQGKDFQSIVVKLFGKNAPSSCPARFAAQGAIGSWSTTVTAAEPGGVSGVSVRKGHAANGTATNDQKQRAAALMDEGRGALKKGDLGKAIAKFSEILKLPETESSPEAQELLGLARQRGKQLAQAQAEYEDYLVRYPAGEGADRVRQRLAGVATASGGGQQTDLKTPKLARDKPDDGTQNWTVSGSAAQSYIRDDSFRTLRDPSLPVDPNEDLEKRETHQNEILSSLDAVATWRGNGVKSKLRFSGTEEHAFDSDEGELIGISALYLDTAVRDWNLEGVVGRQTRNTGGVLGRFDGGVFSYTGVQPIRINAVVGSPVQRRRDEPFLDDKLFYGLSVDIGSFSGFDATLFAIEQRDRSILDRQAIGAELRYLDSEKSAFATVDYDVHFQELNAAILTGSWKLAGDTLVHGTYDYRKSPYLSTWTALQGQTSHTLYDLLKEKTLAEVEDLAVDRTASFTSASIGFSRPLSATYQVSADATVTNFTGTPASGGIAATAGTGNEYFYSAQIIGNSVLASDDLLIAGLRFADLDTSNYYAIDLSARYPVMDSLKVSPHLLLGYRTGDATNLIEYSIMPSVLFNYYVQRDLSLELEVGARWTDLNENSVQETSTDLFFTIGYRYDFYADGSIPSPSRVAPYGAGGPK